MGRKESLHETTIHQTLADQFGFAGSYSSVRRLVQGLKLHQPEATCILDSVPGEAAQVDFGKGPDITDAFTGKTFKTWIFVMTLCFSRHLYAEIITDQKVSTWLSCHRRAFEFFNGVPAKVIDKILLFDGGSIGGLFLLVKFYLFCIKERGPAMRQGKKDGSAAALLRNQLPFWSSHPTRWHFGAHFRHTSPARLFHALRGEWQKVKTDRGAFLRAVKKGRGMIRR